MSLDFDAASHSYTFAGKPVPSVTEIIAPLTDFDSVPRAMLQAAAERGTRVHEAAEIMLRGEAEPGDFEPEISPYLIALESFMRESGAVVVATERRVYHPTLRYAGTLDALLYWKNGVALFDWKSSVSAPRSAGPQTAAYAAALEAMGDGKIGRRYVVNLRPEGYKVERLSSPSDINTFLSCLNVWRFKNGI